MATQTTPGGWLTAKRLRAHGTILALVLWLIYGWNLSTPGLRDRNGNLKGTDFLHFYTLGLLASAHDAAHLYDMDRQATIAAQHVAQAEGLRYLPLYPPQVSILFAPLARLSYGWALAIWWAFSTILYAICCYGLWRLCPSLRDHGGTVAILAAGFPAFFHLIAWGQTSALALACFTVTFFFLRLKRDFLAGLALGCLIFKPQLGSAAAVVFLSIGAWRILAGAMLSSAAQLAVGVIFYGTEPIRRWTHMLGHVSAVWPWLEPRLYQTHSLRTFWSMLIPWPDIAIVCYLLTAAAVLGLTIACWKRGAPLALQYSMLLLATVLVAPHLTVYDLVILTPALLLLADWLVPQSPTKLTRQLGTLLYLIYVLPLVGPLARWTHVQLSVIAMAAAILAIFSISRQIVPHETSTVRNAAGTVATC
jgi:Glycosyltransferase family 87